MGFWFPHQWAALAADIQRSSDALEHSDPTAGEISRSIFSPGTVARLTEDFQALEDYLNNLGAAGLRAATKIVAASNSLSTVAGVADYICSGTNDQTTINTALSAVSSAGGGKVLLMEGTYKIAVSSGGIGIDLPSNVVLEGMGAGTVLQIQAHSADATSFRAIGNGTATSRSNSAIRNVWIDGALSTTGFGTTGIYLQDFSSLLIDGVTVVNCNGAGIWTNTFISTPSGVHISNCRCHAIGSGNFAGTVGIGIYNSSDSSIRDCYVETVTGATVPAYRINTSTRCAIANCAASSVTYVGLMIDVSSDCHAANCSVKDAANDSVYVNNNTHNTYSGLSVSATTTNQVAGIHIDADTDCVLSGCTVTGAGGYGVIVSGTNNLVRDCYVDSSDHSGGGYSGFELVSATDCSVMGCVVRKGSFTQVHGIAVIASASACIVVNNDLKSSGTGASLSDLGAGTLKNMDGSATNWNRL